MTSQERIRAAIARESLDRVPMLEIGFWNETVERFYREGIPRDFVFQSPLWGGGAYHTEHTLEDYFGLDRIAVMAYDGSLRLEQETLEETETYRIFRNADGLTYKAFQNVTAPPLCMDSSVKTRADWEALKERLAADTSRCLPGFAEAYGSAKKKDAYKVIKPEEGCQYAIYLLGDEACYVNMVLEPDWIEDIIRTYTERQIEMMEIILGQGYEFDAMWVFSDLCYKNDMLFSPAFYRERVMPYHKRLFDFCHARGMQVIYHCDGLVERFLPLLIESGIDCIQPLEARCGNDVRKYKQQYADAVAFMGNINADILGTTPERIQEEVREKVLIAKENSGYIFHSDHSVPPSVSLQNYTVAVETAKKYGAYPSATSQR